MNEPGLERPEGYSDEEWEAYQEGAQRMLELSGSFLLSMAGDVGGDGEKPTPTPDPEAADAGVSSEDDAGEDDEYPDTCPDCGMDLVYEMGRDDGVCPGCDLLD